jgi:hypothetical protein
MYVPAPASSARPSRRGAIMIFAAIILVMMFAFVAFSVDVGYMTMTKAQLQNAADAAAMAGVRELSNSDAAVRTVAKAIALENSAAGAPVDLVDADIEIGQFNFATKVFTAGGTGANAVKVTTRIVDQPLFFAPIIQNDDFDMAAESIAMLNPRDIMFVVDLSGSMNDDTEPCWATQTINDKFGPLGYPGVANPLIQDLYTDFGFGTYPGAYQYVGEPLGVPQSNYAYAEMTKDDGPLTNPALDVWYRVDNADDEPTRKQKAYRWLIDYQIAVLMPAAAPTPDSHTTYAYWEKYLDYIMSGAYVGPPPPPSGGGGGGGVGGGGGPEPPLGYRKPAPGLTIPRLSPALLALRPNRVLGTTADVGSTIAVELLRSEASLSQTPPYPGCPRRGLTEYMWLPDLDWDYIGGFNNPNYYTHPASSANIWEWQNRIGYITYVQFMHDWGRDRSPEVDNGTNSDPALAGKTPLSPLSPYCPKHIEATAAGLMNFPPREQPMHAVRRSMIAALQHVKTMNGSILAGYGDRVGIVAYDGMDTFHTPQIVQPLTSDYDAAVLACTNLSAVSDIGATTATEAGLIVAKNHLKKPSEGGAGRPFASRVIVLLTDGVPNAWMSSDGTINSYIAANASSEYYDTEYTWYNSALVQAAQTDASRITLYPIGMGLGTDYDFMDRMARLSGTDEGGLSVRGSGNPAEYEERLTETFEQIVRYPGGRLVE